MEVCYSVATVRVGYPLTFPSFAEYAMPSRTGTGYASHHLRVRSDPGRLGASLEVLTILSLRLGAIEFFQFLLDPGIS